MDEGKNPVAAMTEVLKGSAGAAKEMQSIMLRGSVGGLARFMSALQGVGLAIGRSGILEFFADALDGFAKLLSGLSKTNPALLKWGTIIAGVAAAIGPLLFVMGAMVSVLPALITLFSGLVAATLPLTGTILAVVAAIGLLIAAGIFVVRNWTGVKEFFTALWDGPLVKFLRFMFMVDQLVAAVNLIKAAWAPLKSFFSDLFSSIGNGISSIASKISPILSKVTDAVLFGKSFFSADKGAESKTKEAAGNQSSVNGAISVDFRNAPTGTRVNSSADTGLDLTTNLGFQGASS
jgi:phage-related minor tail protein